MPTAEDGFRRLTLGDPEIVSSIDTSVLPGARRLDARTDALIRISAMIALDAPASSYRAIVDEARSAGVILDDLLVVLVSLAGTVGSARVISAAPKIALAAGYDVETDLEVATRAAPPSVDLDC